MNLEKKCEVAGHHEMLLMARETRFTKNRFTFRKVWAPAEGRDILLVLAFDYQDLQALDSWLSASVQAGLPLYFWSLVQKAPSKSTCWRLKQSLCDKDD